MFSKILMIIMLGSMFFLPISCKCQQEPGYYGSYKIPAPVIAQVYDGKLRICLNDYLGKPQDDSPMDISELKKLTGTIDCNENEIESVSGIHYLTNVDSLDLALNALKVLPDNFSELSQLKQLDLSYNQFTTIPPILLKMPTLEKLSLSGNPITMLRRINEFKKLKTLYLAEIPNLEGAGVFEGSNQKPQRIELNGDSYTITGDGTYLIIE